MLKKKNSNYEIMIYNHATVFRLLHTIQHNFEKGFNWMLLNLIEIVPYVRECREIEKSKEGARTKIKTIVVGKYF